MTDTVDELAYRADVKTRTKEAVVGAKDSVVGTARGAAQRLTAPLPSGADAQSTVSGTASTVADASAQVAGRVSDALPDREQMREVISVAQSNPVGLALGATAVGFLVGLAVPTSRVEDERLGPFADRIKEQVSEVGHESLEHGKEIAQAAAQSAVDTAQEQAREHGQELSSSLQEKTRQISQSD
jgi:hypothetical protein